MKNISPNLIIYHYCSANGFLNIIRNHCLWLSDASCTNDASENRIIDPIFENALRELKAINKIDNKKMEDSRFLYYNTQYPVYLGCFSEEGNLLNQWRNYADDGRGFSIGFSPIKINFDKYRPHMNVDFQNRYFLEKVNYLDGRLAAKYLSFAKSWIKERAFGKDNLNEKELIIRTKESAQFESLRYYCKDSSFKEEKEYRAMWIPALFVDRYGNMDIKLNQKAYEKLRFRATKDKIISYVEMPLENSISKIIMGPKNDMRNHVNCLKAFLNVSGYDDSKIEIIQSTIPYQ
jgi:hypothetical protein